MGFLDWIFPAASFTYYACLVLGIICGIVMIILGSIWSNNTLLTAGGVLLGLDILAHIGFIILSNYYNM